MSRSCHDSDFGKKLYVGNVDPSTTSEELDAAFRKFGKLVAVWVARNPPGFAFVTYEDPRDAEDATKALDGERFNGKNVRVEIARGPRGGRDRGPPDWKNNRGDDDYRERRPPARRSHPIELRRSPSYGPKDSTSRSRSPLDRTRMEQMSNRSGRDNRRECGGNNRGRRRESGDRREFRERRDDEFRERRDDEFRERRVDEFRNNDIGYGCENDGYENGRNNGHFPRGGRTEEEENITNSGSSQERINHDGMIRRNESNGKERNHEFSNNNMGYRNYPIEERSHIMDSQVRPEIVD